MLATENIGVAASTWGVGKGNDAEPISIGYFSVLLVGFVLWVLYGIVQHSWVLIIPNALSAVFGVGVIATALHVQRRQRRAGT